MSAKRRILLVDDSPVVREVASQLLRVQTGHAVEVHGDPFGLVAKVIETRPDLLIVDLEMPHVTGDRMVDILRTALGAAMPLVLLHSDAPAQELERRARACRADAFVRKGDSFILVMRVCQLLERCRRVGS